MVSCQCPFEVAAGRSARIWTHDPSENQPRRKDDRRPDRGNHRRHRLLAFAKRMLDLWQRHKGRHSFLWMRERGIVSMKGSVNQS